MRRHIARAFVFVVSAFVSLAPQVVNAAFVRIIEPESESASVVLNTDLGASAQNTNAESASVVGVLWGGNSSAFAVPTNASIVSLIEPENPNIASDEIIVRVLPVMAATDSAPCPFGGGSIPLPCQRISIEFISFPDGIDVALVGNRVLETGLLQNITPFFLAGPMGPPIFPPGSLTVMVLSPTAETPVHEPATLMLIAIGCVSVTAWSRLRRS